MPASSRGRARNSPSTSSLPTAPISSQPASQEQANAHTEEDSQTVVTTAANPASEPAPQPPLSPVAEDAVAPELTPAQQEALQTARGFFLCSEPGQRFDVRDILPEGGYPGREARRALRKVPPAVLARHGIGTDGEGTFWRV